MKGEVTVDDCPKFNTVVPEDVCPKANGAAELVDWLKANAGAGVDCPNAGVGVGFEAAAD